MSKIFSLDSSVSNFIIRSLSYAKIMQGECRTSSLLECYAEVKLILCKDNARREENEMKTFISYPEPKLILCKNRTFIDMKYLFAC